MPEDPEERESDQKALVSSRSLEMAHPSITSEGKI
jgi:hypothetical protein